MTYPLVFTRPPPPQPQQGVGASYYEKGGKRDKKEGVWGGGGGSQKPVLELLLLKRAMYHSAQTSFSLCFLGFCVSTSINRTSVIPGMLMMQGIA